MIPEVTEGRIVHYVLTEQNAADINRRRTNSNSIKERLVKEIWHRGAQAHIGNEVHAGDVCPMIIVRVWNQDPGTVNGQVILDGTDVLWVTSVTPGDGPGHWQFIQKDAPAATQSTPEAGAAKSALKKSQE